MKKVISFLMALMLLCAMNMATADPTSATGEMTVSLTIDTEQIAPTYIVTIPAEVEIDVTTLTGKAEIVLKSGWDLHAYNYLRVYLTSAQHGVGDSRYGYNFTMKNENGTACRYELEPDNFNYHLAATDQSYYGYDDKLRQVTYKYSTYQWISVSKSSDNTVDKMVALNFRAEELPTDPGTYTDILTFSIQITER